MAGDQGSVPRSFTDQLGDLLSSVPVLLPIQCLSCLLRERESVCVQCLAHAVLNSNWASRSYLIIKNDQNRQVWPVSGIHTQLCSKETMCPSG